MASKKSSKKKPAPKKKIAKAKKKVARKPAPKKKVAKAKAKKPARKPAPKKVRVPKPSFAAERPPEAENAPAPTPVMYPGEAAAADGEGDAEAEVRELFNTYDRDGSGTIERAEFARLMDALGAGLNEEQLAAGLAEVDANHSGRISWGEFSAWWQSR